MGDGPRALRAIRDVADNDIEKFRRPGKTPILYPPEYKTGDLIHP